MTQENAQNMIMLDNIDLPASFNVPAKLSAQEADADNQLFAQAKDAVLKHDALFIAHYYTSPLVQRLAEETGGFIGDSLEMARVGAESPKRTIVVAGVRFMGETAKILSPEKTILMPDLTAECSLDLCCKPEELKKVKQRKELEDLTVVAYANTSAQVKAMSDWIVTSSLAVELADYLGSRKEKILWLPDRHLGSYIANNAQTQVAVWPGRCIVHDSFSAEGIKRLKSEHPEAKVLVHPESSAQVVALGDCIGSTSQLLSFAKSDSAKTYIVATESGIFYKIQQACPDKLLLEAPVESKPGADLGGCAKCPWMALNSLAKVIQCLEQHEGHEIFVEESIRTGALKPLQRMLAFAAAKKSGHVPMDL